MRSKLWLTCGAFVLALALLGGLGGAALAAEKTPPAIADTYVIEGITYYNVNSANFDSPKKFYEDVFNAKHSSLGGRSLGELWMLTAVGVGKGFPAVSAVMGMDAALDTAKKAAMKGYGTEWDNGEYYQYTAPQWHNSGSSGYVETTLYAQPIGSSLTITVRFSDFGVGVILPGNAGHYVSTVVENDTQKADGDPAASARNDSGVSATISQSTKKSISASLASTINHSFSYGFKEGIKAAVGFNGAVFTVGGELSFEASQTITDGWSKSEATTKAKDIENSVSVTLPPYTTAMLKQRESNTTVTTNYNCPVMLSYKVEIEYKPGLGATYHTSFSPKAREDLRQRALVDVDYDSQKINWRTVLADSDFKDAVEKIASHVPMSSTGAKMVYTDRTVYNEVSGFAPLYPLNYISLGWPNLSFISGNKDRAVANMTIGEYSYTNTLPLEGYNSYGAAYYGFNSGNGEWRVVDEAGNELTGDNAPVVLEKTSAGYQKYKAVKPGKCYLRYFIAEDAYPSGLGARSYTKNSDLSRTAQLEVNVVGEKVTYEIEGEYNGTVGRQANLETKGALGGQLEVHAYNADDIEVDAPYSWEKRELRGITLAADGTVTFTKPGTFHVRVRNNADKTVYSDWKAITAEVLGSNYVEPSDPIIRSGFADGDTQFVISGSFLGGANISEDIEGDGKFQVQTQTSNGQETAVQYTWEAQETGKGITLDENGHVSFDNPGVYHVRLKSGAVASEWLEIRANETAPARLWQLPSAPGNYYNGAAQALLNGDARYEGGVRMFYGLGSDDVTPPEEFSTEIPTTDKAGTYYVWCKVQGDENHTDSEPVCVVVKIAGSGDSDSDGDSGSGGNTHSSGGCEVGLGGFAALGLALMVVTWRKK